jgi:glycogen debranching enzyme
MNLHYQNSVKYQFRDRNFRQNYYKLKVFMTTAWNFSGAVAPIGGQNGTVTLVEGSTFCISNSSGDIGDRPAEGLFFRDTRLLSRLILSVNQSETESLSADLPDPFSAVFVNRCLPKPGQADSTLIIFRSRYVGRGMREDIKVMNFGKEAAYCSMELLVDCDFSDLFAVKEGRVTKENGFVPVCEVNDDTLIYSYKRGSVSKGLQIHVSNEAKLSEGIIHFELVIPAKGEWSTCIEFSPVIDSNKITPRYVCGQPVEHSTPYERLSKWRSQVPLITTDHDTIDKVVERSLEDLGALRIFDPDYPERTVVAAGAPWFMTVFGRDSILTSWMALLADPDLALGVLQTLARFQGEKLDPINDEAPGKILHEMRFGEASGLSLGGGSIYYGTADATPLFVMLLGELRRWGLARELVDELLPHADRALEWIEEYGDLDGDGYVEYLRGSDRGLANQGWKDSFDSMRYINGDIATPPIALCEVQGYVYGAYLARAHFAREVGDTHNVEKYGRKAQELKKKFNEDFFIEEKGWFAMGLDAEKKHIDALSSNMGHCLWTGIIENEKAEIVAKKLLGPELFSGWGIRTMGANMGGYNPVSYHCGSVWPHDNAIIAAGLMRYGFVEEAHRVIKSLLEVAAQAQGRLAELYSGFSKDEVSAVVRYPTSCSPQAWAAASPLLAVRTLMRFEPWIPQKKLWISPSLFEGINYLKVDRIPLASKQITVEIEKGECEVTGLPADIEIVKTPRNPATALMQEGQV